MGTISKRPKLGRSGKAAEWFGWLSLFYAVTFIGLLPSILLLVAGLLTAGVYTALMTRVSSKVERPAVSATTAILLWPIAAWLVFLLLLHDQGLHAR